MQQLFTQYRVGSRSVDEFASEENRNVRHKVTGFYIPRRLTSDPTYYMCMEMKDLPPTNNVVSTVTFLVFFPHYSPKPY